MYQIKNAFYFVSGDHVVCNVFPGKVKPICNLIIVSDNFIGKSLLSRNDAVVKILVKKGLHNELSILSVIVRSMLEYTRIEKTRVSVEKQQRDGGFC